MVSSQFNIQSLSSDIILVSFFNFLPGKENATLRKLARSEPVNLQAVIGVLNEHCIFAQPNANDIYDLCCSSARMTLIILPNFSFQMIRKGMRNF